MGNGTLMKFQEGEDKLEPGSDDEDGEEDRDNEEGDDDGIGREKQP